MADLFDTPGQSVDTGPRPLADRLRPQSLGEVIGQDDQALLGATRSMLSKYFGTERAAPRMVKIYRHPRGIPLYAPGHSSRLATLRAAQARHAGLFFAGNHTGGIGVKDCAAAGEALAQQILAWLR